jgi:uncharacterized protein with von Willebrand factor type A (vWA) domain
MSAAELPLHPLFRALRDAGLLLGVADYLALLSALRQGEGGSRAALLRLCKMLWTSSVDEGRILERMFREFVPPEIVRSDSPPEAGSPGPAAADPAVDAPVTQKVPTPPPEAPDSRGIGPVTTSETEGIPAASPASLRAVEIAAATVQGSTAKLDLAMIPRRLAAGEYLPVTQRQLGQSWRRLRRMEARGPLTELDLPATMEEIAKTGLCGRLVLAARRQNVARLLLLVDRDGSMAPFHPLLARITATAVHGSGLRHVDVVSFHNYAVETVERPSGAVGLRELCAVLPAGTGALIVSDAGAARGGHSIERVEGTRSMLDLLGAAVRRLAWINPCPRSRWLGTSAQDVAALVPMFEANRAGFDAALRVLRGRRPFTHGASPWSRT